MRTLTYYVAASLDGYIAGPEGDVDWLFHDQDYGYAAFMEGIDVVLMGTATYDFMLAHDLPAYPDVDNYVFSRTLHAEDHPLVTIVPTDPVPFVAELKARTGRGIWLVGGGVLFRYLLDADLVDAVDVAIHPILLGGGIPLLPERDRRAPLRFLGSTEYDTGLVMLRYAVHGGAAPRG